MPTQDQYMDFLEKISTIRIMHMDRDFFSEDIKNQFEYIKENAEKLSNEEWDKMLENQDSSILHETIVNSKTPIHIVEKAINLCKNERDILEALKREDLPNKCIHQIYDNPMCRDILHKTVCHHISAGTVDEIPYANKHLNYIAEKEFLGEFDAKGRWEMCAVINDAKLVEKLAQNEHLNEWKVDWFLKNPYIPDDLKDKIFDAVGFNYNDIAGSFDNIKHPTPHMVDVLYRQAIDTIDFADNTHFDRYEERLRSGFAKGDAENRLLSLHRQGDLTDAMCYDLIARKIGSKDSRISDNLIYTILKTTKNPDILLLGTQMRNKDNVIPYENDNMPHDEFMKHFNLHMKKVENELKKDRTYKNGGKIPKIWLRRFCNYVHRADLTPDDIYKLSKYYENDYSLMSYIAESKNASNEALKALVEYYNKLYGTEISKTSPRIIQNIAKINLIFREHNIPNYKVRLFGALFRISDRLIKEGADINDYTRMEFLHKDRKRFSFNEEEKVAIQRLYNETTNKEEKDTIEHMLKIIKMLEDTEKRDAVFNLKENTPIRLFDDYNKAINDIAFATRYYTIYEKIDECMENFYQLREELQSRGLLKVVESEKEVETEIEK